MTTRNSKLYCIIDCLLGSRITDLIPAQSDPLAVFGFRQFVDSEVEKTKRDPRTLWLYYCGELHDNGKIDALDEPFFLCNGATADELFERLQQEIFDKEL